jgi:hypothetical protein
MTKYFGLAGIVGVLAGVILIQMLIQWFGLKKILNEMGEAQEVACETV